MEDLIAECLCNENRLSASVAGEGGEETNLRLAYHLGRGVLEKAAFVTDEWRGVVTTEASAYVFSREELEEALGRAFDLGYDLAQAWAKSYSELEKKLGQGFAAGFAAGFQVGRDL